MPFLKASGAMRWRTVVGLSLLALLGMLLGVRQANAAGIPDGYTLTAESETLRLYVDRVTSALIVEDVRNGHLWRSIPADLAENPALNEAWRRRISSPILVSYVGNDRRQVKVADISKRGAEVIVEPTAGGVFVTYRFSREGITLRVAYTVHGDTLLVTLPEAGIVEEGENSLVAVRLLPFLGATHDDEEGYIFFPDGSGMLVRYTTPHPEETQEIARVIYGRDALEEEERSFREPVVLPVFGLTHSEAGYVGIVTQGDFDAKLFVARSGKRVNYNRVGVEFVFRRQGLFSLGGGQPVQVYEPNRIGGDREVRYIFLTTSEANYEGMAHRYRTYLMEEQGAQRVPPDGPLMHVTFFMGVERKTWFLRDLIRMTTFDQASAILSALARADVTRLSVTLRGWNRGGDGARYPQRLPIERRLGGVEGLRELVEAAKARGQPVYLFDNYLDIVPGARGVLPYRDAVRGINGLPAGDGTRGYALNPQIARQRFAVRDLPKMAAFGVNGLTLQHFASLAVPDANDRYPLSRGEFAATWMALADDVRTRFGAVAMTGGNAYAIPHADLLLGVPVDSTHYDLSDETVPFYQIAVHGLVTYAGRPYNLVGDERRAWLRQVEYGAIPHFLLTWEDSAQLYRTSANWIWSSRYADWLGDMLGCYRAMRELAHVQGQFIVAHRRLGDDLYETTYEDGTRVVVNYSSQPQVVDGVPVAGEDFVVLSP